VRWVEVVEIAVGAVVVRAVAADAARVGWVALRPQGQAATAPAPTAATGCRTWQASPAIRKNVPGAGRK
jgi:hypothetical protein